MLAVPNAIWLGAVAFAPAPMALEFAKVAEAPGPMARLLLPVATLLSPTATPPFEANAFAPTAIDPVADALRPMADHRISGIPVVETFAVLTVSNAPPAEARHCTSASCELFDGAAPL